MTKQSRLVNYTLSMGLIILILLFLIALVQISRYVLEDTSPVVGHVTSTRDLLSNIEAVEKNVEESRILDNVNFNNLRCTDHLEADIKRIDTYNMPDGTGIVTYILKDRVQRFNDTYYLEVNSLDDLKIGEHIVFRRSKFNEGVIYDIEEETIKVVNFDTKNSYEISIKDVIGKVVVRLGRND